MNEGRLSFGEMSLSPTPVQVHDFLNYLVALMREHHNETSDVEPYADEQGTTHLSFDVVTRTWDTAHVYVDGGELLVSMQSRKHPERRVLKSGISFDPSRNAFVAKVGADVGVAFRIFFYENDPGFVAPGEPSAIP